jgi:hypothetical protein
MVYNARNYLDLRLFPSSGILKNTTFRKLDLFPSPRVRGPLERANLNYWSKPEGGNTSSF